eukprot:scaffold63479_cov69-Phaeocystis_antarctica.AAC.1
MADRVMPKTVPRNPKTVPRKPRTGQRYREQPHTTEERENTVHLWRRQRRRGRPQSGTHALVEIDSRGVILVREAGERGENTTHHRVGGARQWNVQQEALRAEAACELEDEVVCLGRGRGAQHHGG